MRRLSIIWRREMQAFAARPETYLWALVFVLAGIVLAFGPRGLLETGARDLDAYFATLPWTLALFAPALAATPFAGDAKSGVLDVTLSGPAAPATIALGKWLALWTVAAISLSGVAPLWITASLLGAPDHGAIVCALAVAVLMAGGLTALSAAASAVAPNRAAGYVIGAAVGLGLAALGGTSTAGPLAAALGPDGGALAQTFSTTRQFEGAREGVLDGSALVFYATLAALGVCWTTLAFDARRGG